MHHPPFFVVRNSVHHDAEETTDVAVKDDGSESIINDDCGSSCSTIHENQTRVSTVRLLEFPKRGLYRLDFCHAENAAIIDELVGDGDETRLTYIDRGSWHHLSTFAMLLGKTASMTWNWNPADCYDLPVSEDTTAPRFSLIQEDVIDVLSAALSFEGLFAWQVLLEARSRGDLTWKEIRSFLDVVRKEVAFLTKDGILKSHQPAHVTFHQFVSFSKLIHRHLNCLPRVSCRVVATSATAVDLELKSSHSCSVNIAVVNEDSQPPTSADLQHDNNTFVSWNDAIFIGGTKVNVQINSLHPNTSYRIFLRIDRQTTASSDEDIVKSMIKVITDCQPHIPDFHSMSPEEQRTEVRTT